MQLIFHILLLPIAFVNIPIIILIVSRSLYYKCNKNILVCNAFQSGLRDLFLDENKI